MIDFSKLSIRDIKNATGQGWIYAFSGWCFIKVAHIYAWYLYQKDRFKR